MTPAARVAAAIDCLDQILAGTPAERVLTNWARASRFAGSKDRAAVRDHVFDALRCRASYAALGGALTGRGLMIGALRAQGMELADIFTGEGHAPSPLSATEAALSGSSGAPSLPLDLPDWIADQLHEDLGAQEVARINALMRQRAPVALRVRRGAVGMDQAQASLAADGIVTRRVEDAPQALIISEGERRLRQHALYLTGAVELQDVGAQQLCADIPLTDGMRVLDYCAGGGGKVLALADRANIHGFAHDGEAKRMSDLPARAARAEAQVRIFAPGRVKGQFDVVLVDAPCSGSGTWRRGPDAKWRFSPDDLRAVTDLQAKILNEAAQFVAPQGQLIYATCALFACENQGQVARFDASGRGFVAEHARHRLPDHDGDGFFWAAWRRV